MKREGVAILAAGLEPGYWSTVGQGVSAIALYTIVGVALIVLGRPNAAAIATAGVVSIALIVVLTIYSSSGDLIQGLLGTLVFGVLGLVGQALCVRLIGLVTGIDIGRVLAAERFVPEVLVVVAAYVAFALIIGIAIL